MRPANRFHSTQTAAHLGHVLTRPPVRLPPPRLLQRVQRCGRWLGISVSLHGRGSTALGGNGAGWSEQRCFARSAAPPAAAPTSCAVNVDDGVKLLRQLGVKVVRLRGTRGGTSPCGMEREPTRWLHCWLKSVHAAAGSGARTQPPLAEGTPNVVRGSPHLALGAGAVDHPNGPLQQRACSMRAMQTAGQQAQRVHCTVHVMHSTCQGRVPAINPTTASPDSAPLPPPHPAAQPAGPGCRPADPVQTRACRTCSWSDGVLV